MHRLAEILGSLTVATDLGAGLPSETAIATSVIATRLARMADVQGFELADVYYTGLLRFLGCTAFSHEMAHEYGLGDDLTLLRELTTVNADKPVQLVQGAWRSARGASLGTKAKAVARIVSDPKTPKKFASAHCHLAVSLAVQLAMSEGVIRSLGQIYERWDGKGQPHGLRGEAISRPARILHVAWRLAAHRALEGERGLQPLLKERGGRELDDALCRLAARHLPELLRDLDGPTRWETFLTEEPLPRIHIGKERWIAVAEAFARFTDIKSPYFLGHSKRVGELARSAAQATGANDDELDSILVAGYLHDIGRVVIPNGILDKRSALTSSERRKIEEHDYETSRILSRAEIFSDVARLASAVHERLDAKGYHRGLSASALSRSARVLACADAFVALTQDRAYRPALSVPDAVQTLSRAAEQGSLCRDSLDAVVGAAGHVLPKAAAGQSGLTEREIEVVRLIARGLTNKEIAAQLFISSKTVQRHMENVFGKIGARTRAAVAVFATKL